MITEEQVIAILAQANPEPSESLELDSDAAAYLVTIQERSSEVTQLRTTPTKRETSSRNRLITVTAAVVAVLVVGLVVITSGSEEAPLATPNSPEGIALSFLEAKETYDTATALALVDDDAIVHVGPATSKEEFVFEIAFQEATGLIAKPVGCEGVNGQLICTAEYTTAITRALGSGADTFTYDIEVSDGQITQVRLDPGNYSAENWEPFQAWISRNHPSDLEIMYDGSSAIAMSDESLALWETRTDQYIEDLTGDADR